MKKLIIALIAFLLIVGACIFEIVYTTDAYSELESLSARVTESGMVCVECKKENELSLQTTGREDPAAKSELEQAAQKTLSDIEQLTDCWLKKRTLTLSLGNHSVVKSLEERIYTLKQQHSTEQWEDLTVTSSALTAYLRGLKDDTHPTLPNLF